MELYFDFGESGTNRAVSDPGMNPLDESFPRACPLGFGKADPLVPRRIARIHSRPRLLKTK